MYFPSSHRVNVKYCLHSQHEADFIGLHLMAAAGYDPCRGLRAFEKLAVLVSPTE